MDLVSLRSLLLLMGLVDFVALFGLMNLRVTGLLWLLMGFLCLRFVIPMQELINGVSL